MDNEFEGLVAVVTGGASGIGAAIADRLAEGGAKIAVLDLNPADSRHYSVECNVAEDTSVRAAVNNVVTRFGRLDILINTLASEQWGI